MEQIEAYCYVYTILHTGYGTTLVSRGTEGSWPAASGCRPVAKR